MCNCGEDGIKVEDKKIFVFCEGLDEWYPVDQAKFCPFCGESLQPERSKREDSCKDGHDWMHVPLSDYVDCRRCGALNSMET